jgi:hypothetical protein
MATAKTKTTGVAWKPEPTNKGTSIGRRNIKMSSMNKAKKRSFKPYRGQGK